MNTPRNPHPFGPTSTRRFLALFCGALVLMSLAETASAQRFRTQAQRDGDYVVYTTPVGQSVRLLAQADSDGDGVENEMELDGYFFDPRSGELLACNPAIVDPCYQTDPLDWTTDGDPYSDFMEVSGVNMPADIPRPFTHPLVAARPVISMVLDSYSVTPNGTITNTRGGEQSSSFTNSVTTSEEVGAEIKSSTGFSPTNLFSLESTTSYSVSESHTQSSTSTFGRNWSNTRSTNPSEAGKLSLRVRLHNLGSATARNVRPTLNLLIGEQTIATLTLGTDDQVLSLAPGGYYPSAGGTVVIDRDSDNNEIYLTLQELQAIQSGAPLRLEVVQVAADVVRWNLDSQSFSDEVEWSAFENEINAVSLTLKVETGKGRADEYQIFAGSQFFDPGYTLEDLAGLVLDLEDRNSEQYIEGRRYPEDWYLGTPSQVLLDAWEVAGRPRSLLGVEMKPNTRLFMLSPGPDPGPVVNLASFGPGMRKVYALAQASGGFPIASAKAEVYVNGQMREITLEKEASSPFYTNATELEAAAETNADGSYGRVRFSDARGDETVERIFPALNVDCYEVKENEPVLPSPGGEYLTFANADPGRPVQTYCEFFDASENPLDPVLSSYWFPVSHEFTGTIWDIAFTSPTHGHAVGGSITNTLRTTDGGETWTLAPIVGATSFAYNGVGFANENIGTAVGFFQSIIRTTDGGQTWAEVQAFDGGILNAVAFANQNIGVAVGSSLGVIYRSTDAGVSWIDVTPAFVDAEGLRLHDVAFFDDNTGLIAGFGSGSGGAILRTEDGGQTWAKMQIDAAGSLFSLAILDANTAVAVGGELVNGVVESRVHRSTDGGQTWSEMPSEGNQTLFDVAFTDAEVGFAAGRDGLVLRTMDGGQTWTEQYSRSTAQFNGVAVAGQNTVFIGGNGGAMIRTQSRGGDPVLIDDGNGTAPRVANDFALGDEDGGDVTVNVIDNDNDPNGSTLTLTAYTQPSAGSVAQVGASSLSYTPPVDYSGTVSFSYTVVNGAGEAASASVSITLNPANDLPFFTSDPIVEGAAGGTYSYTATAADLDGDGLSFNASTKPAWMTLTDNRNGTATLSGTPGTGDSGEHAVVLKVSDGISTVEQVYAVTVAVTVGAPGVPTLAAPENGAINIPLTLTLDWEGAASASSYEVQVATSESFATTVVDEKGVAQTSFSPSGLQGNTTYFWRVRAANSVGAGGYTTAFRFTTEAAAVPFAPGLTEPANGAINIGGPITLRWNASSGATSYEVQVATSESFAAVVVDETGVSQTSFSPSGLQGNTTYFWRVRAVNGAGESDYTAAFRFTTAVGVATESETVPEEFQLLQNYPNPFNPQTTIGFSIAQPTRVQIQVFNLLGQHLQTLVDATYRIGRHEVTFEAGDLPSGSYLYRIQTDEFVDTRVMILLK